jgi:hypothetical protein
VRLEWLRIAGFGTPLGTRFGPAACFPTVSARGSTLNANVDWAMAAMILDPAVPHEPHALIVSQAPIAVSDPSREMHEEHLTIFGRDPSVDPVVHIPTDCARTPHNMKIGPADVQINGRQAQLALTDRNEVI